MTYEKKIKENKNRGGSKGEAQLIWNINVEKERTEVTQI